MSKENTLVPGGFEENIQKPKSPEELKKIQEDIQNAIAKHELYAMGEDVLADWQQAFDSYVKLAKQDNAKAQFNLGYMYARGDVVERDFSKAYECYQKAADQDDPRAHYNLAQMYTRGEFVSVDSGKAEEHLKRAIALGDERAVAQDSDRAQIAATLASAKEALKLGDRDKALQIFSTIADSSKEAQVGPIACSVAFKSLYNIHIKYSYHSSGSSGKKKFWKWGDAVVTEVDLTMSNNSTQGWNVLVKPLIRDADGNVGISTLGGVLRAGETQSNIIDPEKYAGSNICGVTIYSDRDGSADKPAYSFDLPNTPLTPSEADTKNLPLKVQAAQSEMHRENMTAKPSDCFVLTACYGSGDAPTVLAFRQFRDNHLSQYTLGRGFISWYYTKGPKWAAAVESYPRVKAIFRWIFNHLAKFLPE